MIISAAASIELNKQALNDLNVFPVPDGDTGTNMSMTINAAAADLRKLEDPSLDKAANAAASGRRTSSATTGAPCITLNIHRNTFNRFSCFWFNITRWCNLKLYIFLCIS